MLTIKKSLSDFQHLFLFWVHQVIWRNNRWTFHMYVTRLAYLCHVGASFQCGTSINRNLILVGINSMNVEQQHLQTFFDSNQKLTDFSIINLQEWAMINICRSLKTWDKHLAWKSPNLGQILGCWTMVARWYSLYTILFHDSHWEEPKLIAVMWTARLKGTIRSGLENRSNQSIIIRSTMVK